MDDINFSILASQDPDFAKILKSNGQLDFSNPEAVLQLTKSLLKQHFNLKIELPPDRLCPPVPNRLNYIKWIQELIDTTSSLSSDAYEPEREVVGLDIGTGASCIYPLLGCASRPSWKFMGTDIDDKSFSYAQKNVELNHLPSRIRLLKTTNEGPLIPREILGIETITFTICNPPFYTSTESLLQSCSQKSRPPFTACTGSASEMIYPGGEVAFISRLVTESLELKGRVQWYTSMVGKLESLKEILVILKTHKITNYALKELIQGAHTRRWAIAWSHLPLIPSLSASRGIQTTSSSSSTSSTGIPKQSLPFPSEFDFSISGKDVDEVEERVVAILTSLPISIHYALNTAPTSSTTTLAHPAILIFARSNVWSRASRRQLQHQNKESSPRQTLTSTSPSASPSTLTSSKEMPFGFRISFQDALTPDNSILNRGGGGDKENREDIKDGNNMRGGGKGIVIIKFRWIKGTDSVVFESFCGMVKRKMDEV